MSKALKDITTISKEEFKGLSMNEQMKYIDRGSYNSMISTNKTQKELTTNYGQTVADEIMLLDIPDKDKIKTAKKYRSVNQTKMDNSYNNVFTSLEKGEGFYPIGDQPTYSGLNSDSFFEEYSPLLDSLNPYETKTFYDQYSKLQKLEGEKYKADVTKAKDIDTENKEFHTDVENQMKRIGNVQEVNDIFTEVVRLTESQFKEGPEITSASNPLITVLQDILDNDLGVYGNMDTAAFLNKETGEYHIPNLTSITKIEQALDDIITNENFDLPIGGDSWNYEALKDNPEMAEMFQNNNKEKAKLQWKKAMLAKIITARKALLGEIPLAITENSEFNKMLKEDWTKTFTVEPGSQFDKYKVVKE